MSQRLKTAVANYATAFRNRFNRASGPQGYAPFVNNAEGKFQFDLAPMISRMTIVNNDADLGYAKATLPTNLYIFNNWYRISRGNWSGGALAAAVGFSDQAIPAESAAFVFHAESGNITNASDTKSMVGFVSPDAYDQYTFDVTLKSSSNWQNDPIGVIVGYARDQDGTAHTLSVFRSPRSWVSGLGNNAMHVSVDFVTMGSTSIKGTSKGLHWAGGGSAEDGPTQPGPGGTPPAYAVQPWAQAPNGIRLIVTRNGDNFNLKTSDYNGTVLVPEAELNFTLNDHPSLARFKGKSPYGYAAVSQDNAIWETAIRPGGFTPIYDARNDTLWTYNGTVWSSAPATVVTRPQPNRFYFTDFNRKLFHCGADAVVRQVKND